MATTNIWKQFTSLLPKNYRSIVTIISNNANGTSNAQLRDGTQLIIIGSSLIPGKKVVIVDSSVVGEVPDLPHFYREI